MTASGNHVPFGVPGDALLDDGALAWGPHHRDPPCRHFPECGGCQLQQADDEAYRAYLVSRIKTALEQHGIETDMRSPHLSPPNSRRRASVRAIRINHGCAIGFNAEKSHRIVDMRECHILRPELFALVQPLRSLLARILDRKRSAEIQMTWIDGGPDLVLRGVPSNGLRAIEELTSFAADHRLIRLSIDHGNGPETIYEPQPATVTLSGRPVAFPVGGFLQATQEGEAALVESVCDAVHGASRVADLFAGLGTFALAIQASYAAEASRDAAASLKRAAATMIVDHRDLYRRPLDTEELNRFGAVILDPPRAGAAVQGKALAASAVEKIAYVSCNPATFARDARVLVDGGYTLQWVRPVGQFRWSTHVELAACFTRGG